MNRWRRFIKFPTKQKSLSMKKSSGMRGSLWREQSPTTMQSKPRSNISAEKSKKQSWCKNPSKKYTKEFNTSPSRLRSFITQSEKTTLLPRLKPGLNMWELLEVLKGKSPVDTRPTLGFSSKEAGSEELS